MQESKRFESQTDNNSKESHLEKGCNKKDFRPTNISSTINLIKINLNKLGLRCCQYFDTIYNDKFL